MALSLSFKLRDQVQLQESRLFKVDALLRHKRTKKDVKSTRKFPLTEKGEEARGCDNNKRSTYYLRKLSFPEQHFGHHYYLVVVLLLRGKNSVAFDAFSVASPIHLKNTRQNEPNNSIDLTVLSQFLALYATKNPGKTA